MLPPFYRMDKLIEFLRKTAEEDTPKDYLISLLIVFVIALFIHCMAELTERLERYMDEKYRKRCFNCKNMRKVKKPGKEVPEYYECDMDGHIIGYVDSLKKSCDKWEQKPFREERR